MKKIKIKKIHQLKIKEKYLEDILKGLKTFEIRKNDRNYKIGDLICFKNKYLYEIIYITNYEQKDNYVVLGIKKGD